MKKDKRRIPKGFYCYGPKGRCPYWSTKDNLPDQENGYCSFLEKSDWDINEERGAIEWESQGKVTQTTQPHEIPISLLWDACKMCGVKDEAPADLMREINEAKKESKRRKK